MPRSLVIGNGNVLVGFDANYSVRDIFFPRVGDANHTMGNVCRTGFFIDGKFAWVYDPGWERHLGYAEDSLESNKLVMFVLSRVSDYRIYEVYQDAGFSMDAAKALVLSVLRDSRPYEVAGR